MLRDISDNDQQTLAGGQGIPGAAPEIQSIGLDALAVDLETQGSAEPSVIGGGDPGIKGPAGPISDSTGETVEYQED